MRILPPLTFLTLTLTLTTPALAGPAAYGICQAGCAAVVTACYAAAVQSGERRLGWALRLRFWRVMLLSGRALRLVLRWRWRLLRRIQTR